MMCTCWDHSSLEVVDEGPLEVSQESMEFGLRLKAFEPSEGCGFQGYWEVECLGGVGSARYFDGDGVATNQLARVLLAIVLGDAEWFVILGVGPVDDVGGEHRKAVTIIGVMIYVGSVPSPCLNDAPRVTTVVDFRP
jgi:hypothetical protein